MVAQLNMRGMSKWINLNTASGGRTFLRFSGPNCRQPSAQAPMPALKAMTPASFLSSVPRQVSGNAVVICGPLKTETAPLLWKKTEKSLPPVSELPIAHWLLSSQRHSVSVPSWEKKSHPIGIEINKALSDVLQIFYPWEIRQWKHEAIRSLAYTTDILHHRQMQWQWSVRLFLQLSSCINSFPFNPTTAAPIRALVHLLATQPHRHVSRSAMPSSSIERLHWWRHWRSPCWSEFLPNIPDDWGVSTHYMRRDPICVLYMSMWVYIRIYTHR